MLTILCIRPVCVYGHGHIAADSNGNACARGTHFKDDTLAISDHFQMATAFLALILSAINMLQVFYTDTSRA
jgi:hypothetical protein